MNIQHFLLVFFFFKAKFGRGNDYIIIMSQQLGFNVRYLSCYGRARLERRSSERRYRGWRTECGPCAMMLAHRYGGGGLLRSGTLAQLLGCAPLTTQSRISDSKVRIAWEFKTQSRSEMRRKSETQNMQYSDWRLPTYSGVFIPSETIVLPRTMQYKVASGVQREEVMSEVTKAMLRVTEAMSKETEAVKQETDKKTSNTISRHRNGT